MKTPPVETEKYFENIEPDQPVELDAAVTALCGYPETEPETWLPAYTAHHETSTGESRTWYGTGVTSAGLVHVSLSKKNAFWSRLTPDENSETDVLNSVLVPWRAVESVRLTYSGTSTDRETEEVRWHHGFKIRTSFGEFELKANDSAERVVAKIVEALGDH